MKFLFDEHDTTYLAMDYLEGETLDSALDRAGGRLSWRRAVNLMLPILDGLQYVHDHGVLHRDVKPSNVYVTAGERPVLLDFGAARQFVGERTGPSRPS